MKIKVLPMTVPPVCRPMHLPGYLVAALDALSQPASRGTVDRQVRKAFVQCRLGIDPAKQVALAAFHGDRPDPDSVVGGVLSCTCAETRGGVPIVRYSFDVAVLPGHRKGVGFDLIRAAVAQAPDVPGRPCVVSLLVVNPEVEPILRWLGFEVDHRYRLLGCRMEKWLSSFRRNS